jgi:hypothetical protein
MTSGTPSDAIERMSLKNVFIGNGRKKFRCRAQNGGGYCVIFCSGTNPEDGRDASREKLRQPPQNACRVNRARADGKPL